MSREERKMAQIIASIERMEQEARASGDDSAKTQEPHESSRQGGRGKKGKKSKYSGLKAKTGRKLKVTAVAGGAKAPFERKLTPKKRWIQLWSAQMDTAVAEKDASSSSERPKGAAEKEPMESELAETASRLETPAVLVAASSSGSELKVAPVAPLVPMDVAEKKEEKPKISEKPVALPTVAPAHKQKAEKEPPASPPVRATESKPQEHITQNKITEAPKGMIATPKATTTPKMTITPKAASAAASSSSELRVKTPLNNETSHLSPPLERNSPTTTASISPSAKVKDNDTPNNNTVAASAAAAKFSPEAAEEKTPVVTEKKDISGTDSDPRLERKSSNSSSVGKDRHLDHGRKRSLERTEPPMSEEAKRRAERRRKRRSNWDVGDPRKGGSPVADPPISAAAAAANQQSFAKYPPNRPSWRHSQSMMDMKPHFQSAHRSSSFYNNGPNPGGRRGFYPSTSLPQDRSRSAGRSSTRHSYGNTSSGSNYR